VGRSRLSTSPRALPRPFPIRELISGSPLHRPLRHRRRVRCRPSSAPILRRSGCGPIRASPPARRTIPRAHPRVSNTAVRKGGCPVVARRRGVERGVLSDEGVRVCGVVGPRGVRSRRIRNRACAITDFGEMDQSLARGARCELVSSSASFGIARAGRPQHQTKSGIAATRSPSHRWDAEEHFGKEVSCSFGWVSWIRSDWAKKGKFGAIRRRTVGWLRRKAKKDDIKDCHSGRRHRRSHLESRT
jgi:hypothetical protein